MGLKRYSGHHFQILAALGGEGACLGGHTVEARRLREWPPSHWSDPARRPSPVRRTRRRCARPRSPPGNSAASRPKSETPSSNATSSGTTSAVSSNALPFSRLPASYSPRITPEPPRPTGAPTARATTTAGLRPATAIISVLPLCVAITSTALGIPGIAAPGGRMMDLHEILPGRPPDHSHSARRRRGRPLPHPRSGFPRSSSWAAEMAAASAAVCICNLCSCSRPLSMARSGEEHHHHETQCGDQQDGSLFSSLCGHRHHPRASFVSLPPELEGESRRIRGREKPVELNPLF